MIYTQCNKCINKTECRWCTLDSNNKPSRFIMDKEPSETEKDAVNHPSHYTSGEIECIDALESATVNLSGIEAVCTANAIKYLWRWKQKNGIEDLHKAQWYINKIIEKQGGLNERERATTQREQRPNPATNKHQPQTARDQ